MCLAIPGRILDTNGEEGFQRAGRVDFGGVVKEVNLAYVPEADVGIYVIVHVGFAINTLDEEEAGEVFHYLNQMAELQGLQPVPRDET